MSSRKSNASDLCICKLCTCGRHHCPHQAIRSVPSGPCAFSEYTDEFTRHQLPTLTSYKPAAVYRRDGAPMEDRTNNRLDYVPHALEKRFVHQANEYKRPEGEFEKNTSYTTDFLPRKGERAHMFKRIDQRPDLGKFDAVPLYKSEFQDWGVSPREQHGKSPEWVPPMEQFGGVPTYSSDYVQYQDVAVRPSFRPENQPQATDKPFQGETDYRLSYKQYPMEARPVKDRVEWYPPSVPFKGDTTTHSDYKEKPLSLSKSYKPVNTARMSLDPLASDTTSHSDYRVWEHGGPIYKHRAAPYKAPEGDMAQDTTYLREYRGHGGPQPRAVAFKPRRERGDLGHFDGSTSYSMEFKEWQLAARHPYGPSREWVPSEEPMEGHTTSGLSYIAKPIEMRPSFKRPGESHVSVAPFAGETTYKTEYQGHVQDICPTLNMNTPRATWQLTGNVNETGHHLVAPKETFVEVAVH